MPDSWILVEVTRLLWQKQRILFNDTNSGPSCFPCAQPTVGKWRGPGAAHTLGLHPAEEPQAWENPVIAQSCPRMRHSLYYPGREVGLIQKELQLWKDNLNENSSEEILGELSPDILSNDIWGYRCRLFFFLLHIHVDSNFYHILSLKYFKI